jgi:acyl-CoA hydrolase
MVNSFYTKDKPTNRLDVTIVEASAITEDGGIIPGASVGASPELIQMADKIIIEVNTAAPSFEGLHDITMTDLPPRRKPYLIMSPEDRIGTPHIPIDPERVVAIVESDYPDQTQPNAPEDDNSRAIASNLIEFLKHEVKHGRLPDNLLPIQSGIGNIANAVVGGLAVSHCLLSHMQTKTDIYSPVAQISKTSKSGPKSSKTPSLTSSTPGTSTLRPQPPSASRRTASSASTRTGTNTRPNSSCAPSKSVTAPRLSAASVLSV